MMLLKLESLGHAIIAVIGLAAAICWFVLLSRRSSSSLAMVLPENATKVGYKRRYLILITSIFG
jgi:hypothetical protein